MSIILISVARINYYIEILSVTIIVLNYVENQDLSINMTLC